MVSFFPLHWIFGVVPFTAAFFPLLGIGGAPFPTPLIYILTIGDAPFTMALSHFLRISDAPITVTAFFRAINMIPSN
jgi:hypothetical protein